MNENNHKHDPYTIPEKFSVIDTSITNVIIDHLYGLNYTGVIKSSHTGSYAWFINGKIHREDGPAFITQYNSGGVTIYEYEFYLKNKILDYGFVKGIQVLNTKTINIKTSLDSVINSGIILSREKNLKYKALEDIVLLLSNKVETFTIIPGMLPNE